MGQAVAECWNCGHPNVVLEVERPLSDGDFLTYEERKEIAAHADDLCGECEKPLRGSYVKAAADLMVSAEGFAG